MRAAQNFSKLLRGCISALPGKGLRVFSHYKRLRGHNNILSRKTCRPRSMGWASRSQT